LSEREHRKAWEDEQVFRKLDSLHPEEPGRYMLVRSTKLRRSPYAVLFLKAGEQPEQVADGVDAEVLEVADGTREEMDRLVAEKVRLNSVTEVMES